MEYPSGTNWYPVITRSREEILTASLLESKGLDVFIPLYKKEVKDGIRNGKPRKKLVDTPLLSRYIFCNVNLDKTPSDQYYNNYRSESLKKISHLAYYIINTTPGVVGLVGIGNKALVVDEESMDYLLDMFDIENGKYYHKPKMKEKPPATTLEAGIEAGKVVSITDGPFTGYSGTFESMNTSGIAEILNEQFFKWCGKRLKIDGHLLRLVQ